MNTFIAHATQRRISTAIPAALVLMAIYGAAPAIAGGASKPIGDIDSQGTASLFGGGGSLAGGGVDALYGGAIGGGIAGSGIARYNLPSTTPTIGFDHAVKGKLGDGDEVYLDTGQLADFYRFSTQAAKMTYTITATSRQFLMDSSVYVLDAKRQVYVVLQAAKVFTPDAPMAQYGGTLPKAGEYAIQISSAFVDDQNGRYTVHLTAAPDTGDVLDQPSGAGGTKIGGSTGDEVHIQGSKGGIQSDGGMSQLQGTKLGAGAEI